MNVPKSSDTSKITRNAFLKTAGLLPLLAHPARIAGASQGPSAEQLRSEAGASFRNGAFELHLSAHRGLRVTLKHLPSGLLLADGAYSYSFGEPTFERVGVEQEGKTRVVRLAGRVSGSIQVEQEFRIPADSPWMQEQLRLTNRASHAISLPNARCGFVLPVKLQDGQATGPLGSYQFTAVPFRREPSGNRSQYADYTIGDVLTKLRRSNLRADNPLRRRGEIVNSGAWTTGLIQQDYPQYASEGWLLRGKNDGFLISKYSQLGMEFAVLDHLLLEDGMLGLRWGGLAIFEGDPEAGARLAPGASHQFGATRITAYQGGLEDGFYAFRSEMDARGQGCPKGFDPPAHWNEIYDNKLWWLPDNGQDNAENRTKYYRLEDMKEEAAKAHAIGCEALYLDPGWDTSFASKIWDTKRLGDLRNFVKMLREQYDLSLSLHTPLSGWCNPTSYDRSIDRLGPDGQRIEKSLCGASQQYVEESAKRFLALAAGGTAYFMFDGTRFNGECWDPGHGHAVPSTREEHVQATNLLARLIHEKYPNVLIEMHDQILGGTTLRYVPVYYGYGMPPPGVGGPQVPGFDCVWAFELMWDPMKDLVGGQSIALYYYNLAYSLPLYIHIDLRKDNQHALMLWWNISTCRYLGLGGTHEDPATRKKQKDAMTAYRRLKKFFASGRFYGIDEQTHVHVHPEEPGAVINCFNLEEGAVSRTIEFDPKRFGLDADKTYQVQGATVKRDQSRYVMTVRIPGYGHTLVELFKQV